MKLLSFERQKKAGYGAVKGDGVVDLGQRLSGRYPTLRSLIAGDALAEARAIVDSSAADFGLDSIAFMPVIPDAGKIFGIGLNYAGHVAEIGAVTPSKPSVFLRTNDSLVGHGQPLLKAPESNMFDWEVELCVIIGKPGRRIAAKDALSHVAGYTVMNEGSMRDWLKHTPLLSPGKNFYHSGALGPWMVTADELLSPAGLRISTKLNGRIVQDSTTSDLVFDVPALIEYLSIFTPLSPGDMIATGTPAGVGAGMKPPLFLRPGDVLEQEIQGIGVLRNHVIEG